MWLRMVRLPFSGHVPPSTVLTKSNPWSRALPTHGGTHAQQTRNEARVKCRYDARMSRRCCAIVMRMLCECCVDVAQRRRASYAWNSSSKCDVKRALHALHPTMRRARFMGYFWSVLSDRNRIFSDDASCSTYNDGWWQSWHLDLTPWSDVGIDGVVS
jgi:hypothetical protein